MKNVTWIIACAAICGCCCNNQQDRDSVSALPPEAKPDPRITEKEVEAIRETDFFHPWREIASFAGTKQERTAEFVAQDYVTRLVFNVADGDGAMVVIFCGDAEHTSFAWFPYEYQIRQQGHYFRTCPGEKYSIDVRRDGEFDWAVQVYSK